MSKQLVIGAIVGIIVGGGIGAWGGMQYQASQNPVRNGFGNAGGTFSGRSGGVGGSRSGAGAIFGTIISADASSITVQIGGPSASTTNGAASGTKIALLDNSTQIEKIIVGSVSDLTVGRTVMVSGTANSDGSITAQSIQIRPAGARPAGQ